MAYSQAVRFAPAVAGVCTMAIKGTTDTAVESVYTLAGLFSGQTQDAEQNASESQEDEQHANNPLRSDSEPFTFVSLQRTVSAGF